MARRRAALRRSVPPAPRPCYVYRAKSRGGDVRGRAMKISFAEFQPPRSGAVVVGVWEDRVLAGPARQLDELSGGAVTRALAASPRFRGKRNELLPIVGPANLGAGRIVVAGLGKPEAADARMLQDLGGTLAAHLNGVGETEAAFAVDIGAAG